ncbi:MAG: response regulator [Spirochaetaceae bacterium]|jgi:YesN/AraC family two-component response regulator|nr:response regulator [Spirochaetaceae bacterium]
MEDGFEIAVVDDEEWVRRGLISKLSKSGLPVRLIRDFADGESVINYIEKGKNPDIIICDIRMPGVDGLNVASAVRSRFPDIRVIVASGYGEFEYAKRAIRVGVSEYLLKPIDDFEFFVALKTCMDSISISRKNSERLVYLQRIERENRARCCLGSGVGAGDLSDLFPAYGGISPRFICAYFRVPHISETDFHDLVNRMGPGFLRGIEIDNSVLYSCIPEEYVLLFLIVESVDRIKEFARLIALEIREGISAGTSAAAGISGIREDAGTAVIEALELMKYQVFFDEPILIGAQDIAGRNESYYIPGHYISALRYALNEGSEKNLNAVLKTIESETGALKLSYRCLENVYLQLLMPANEFLSSPSGGKSALFIKDAYKFGTLSALFTFVKDTYAGCIKIADKSATGGKSRLIQAIAASIDVHFNEYITLELTAANYGINACYLSLLFKEVIGVNFQEYLSHVRIRNAKEFLASGRYKVGEVAEKTGYSNRLYFSKAFKKIEGLTPSEFMNTVSK